MQAEAVLETQVRAALARLDVAPVTDPLRELAKLAGEVLAWKDALAAHVNALQQIRYEADGAGTEQLRSEIVVFERAMDRAASVLGLIAKLNLDARLVAIDEARLQMVQRAIWAALDAAGVVEHRAREAAARAAARELRVIKGEE